MAIITAAGVDASFPRIMWDSVFRREGSQDVLSSTGDESTEFAMENAVIDPATWNFWRPSTMPGALEIYLETAEVVDYALIAAHTLGTDSVTVSVQYDVGGSSPGDWATVATTTPTDDTVLAFLFTPTTARRWRLLFSEAGSPTARPSVGVAMLGRALTMPRGVRLDHGPITLQRRTIIEPNRSEGGAFLGRSIRRLGASTQVGFSQLEEEFVRGEFLDFITAARTHPWGWAWSPADRSDDVAYVWTLDDIRPRHEGLQNYLSVEFEIDGILE
jgi:hypothetical protein